MLNLRSGLVLTAAALCLWALWSLLSSLRQPGLLRTEKAAVLKGCDALDDEDTRRACLPLFCQKALLDAKLAPWNARFTVQTQRVSSADATVDIVAGTVSTSSRPGMNAFGCLLRGNGVELRAIFDDAGLQKFIGAADDDPANMPRT